MHFKEKYVKKNISYSTLITTTDYGLGLVTERACYMKEEDTSLIMIKYDSGNVASI